MHCSFLPPYLLRRLAEGDARPGLVADRVPDDCRRTLELDERMRARRAATGPVRPAFGGAAWTVHDAQNGSALPGVPARAEGEPETGDAAVDEAAHGIDASLRLCREVLGRDSYDGRGAPAVVTVHFGQDYVNAFWDGTQLVFGDGDGEVFGRFTRPVDVLGHEFAHALTQHTAGLVYADQPGALNESVSDVYAACLEQWLLGQSAEEADWLIGTGLFLPGVRARALRDMRAPGTAYDDPALGTDPQVGSMADYVVTSDDNGGVHLNSGIPNRAFHLAATAIGGATWQGAGPIWFAALTGGRVGPRTDFAGFARATVAEAGEHADAVERAWREVGVSLEGEAPTGPARPTPVNVVEVRRSGGFLGRTTAAHLDLDGDDDRVPEVRELVERVDLAAVAPTTPQPDRFVYTFRVPGGPDVTVPEDRLTDPLRRLAHLLLP